jgi:hypothetical protein
VEVESLVVLIGGFVVLYGIVLVFRRFTEPQETSRQSYQYTYGRREAIMTEREAKFFHTLEAAVKEKYFVFPQVRLSSLVSSKASGKHYKAGINRLNKKSVDYVLCERVTLETAYVIELDDSSHDRPDRVKRDDMVEESLRSTGYKLVRFRNIKGITSDQIIEQLSRAHES